MSSGTCQDLIETKCKDRIINMARCLGGSKASEQRNEEFWDRVLSVDSFKVHRVCLSWGGPADYFEIHVKDGSITDIYYLYQDWYDEARLELKGKAFDVAERMFSYFGEED